MAEPGGPHFFFVFFGGGVLDKAIPTKMRQCTKDAVFGCKGKQSAEH